MSESHDETATAQVLEWIVEFYLTSGDYNGLPVLPDSGLYDVARRSTTWL